MVPSRLIRLAWCVTAALSILMVLVAPTSAGPSGAIAELEYSPATVAPGDTVAVSGRCLTNGSPTQVARVVALIHEEGPPAENFSMAVVYGVDATGGFSGGFVVPSNARVGDWGFSVSCLSGDVPSGSSEPAPLRVVDEPGGPFAMDITLSPGTIEPGDVLRVTGHCTNDGAPTETARLEVVGLWPELFTPFVVVEAPVDLDGSFAADLTYPADGPFETRAVVLLCRSGADVIAHSVAANFTVTEPVEPVGPPPAGPVPVLDIGYTG